MKKTKKQRLKRTVELEKEEKKKKEEEEEKRER